jgi:solute carrier family 35 protein F5
MRLALNGREQENNYPYIMKKEVLGLLLLTIVVILWVSSSVVIQSLFTTVGYYKPYFLTYASTSMFSVYLVSLP